MIRHIIHKQQVSLKVPKMDEALNYQSSVSLMFKNELADQLATLFDSIAPAHTIIRLDTVRLDLGAINSANFDKEFKERVIEKMQQEISKRKQEMPVQKSESSENETSLVSQGHSLRDSLIYFLWFGSLPWYAVSKKTKEWENEIMAGFSKTDWQFFVKWLQKSGMENDVVCRRLVLQFSDAFLQEIFSKGLPSNDLNIQLLYHDVSYLLTTVLNEPVRKIRSDIWIQLLNYLILNPDSHAVPLVILKLFVLKLSPNQLEPLPPKLEKIQQNLQTKDVRKVLFNLARLIGNEKQKHHGKKQREFDADFDGNKEPVDLRLVATDRLAVLLSAETPPVQAIDEYDIREEEWLKEPPRVDERAGFTNKKNRKASSVSPEDAFYVSTSGLVLLHPFLQSYFTELELMENGKFLSEALHSKAVLLLHYLATGNEEVAEFDLTLEKIIAGFPLEETLPAQMELTTQEKDESAKLLQTVIDYWPPLKNTSVQGLQSSFLQRDGKLTLTDSGWLLVIEQKTLDVLLGKLPWGFSTIRLRWMKEMISVEWY